MKIEYRQKNLGRKKECRQNDGVVQAINFRKTWCRKQLQHLSFYVEDTAVPDDTSMELSN